MEGMKKAGGRKMNINITVNVISKTVKINEECFVDEVVIVKLRILKDKDGKRVINFDYAVD